MRNNTLIFILLLILLFENQTYPQSLFDNNEIAKVGDKSITKDEFLQRIELTPQFNKHIKKLTLSLKLEFLFTLIAEKLMANEAERKGFDTSTAIISAANSIEKMFVRDALFKQEIKSKIIIKDEDWIIGNIRNAKIYKSRYLFSTDSAEIQDLYNSLKTGISFDSLLKVRSESNEQQEIIDIYYGDLIESIENKLFELNPGQFTIPTAADDGWYIFFVYDIKEIKYKTREEIETANKKVKDVIEERLGENIQSNFYRKFFSNKKVDVNSELFELLVNKLNSVFELKQKQKLKEDGTLYNLLPEDIYEILNSFPDSTLNKPFIEFEDRPVSFRNFINEFGFNGFQLETARKDFLIKKLSTEIRIFIERELLAREGYRRHLETLPEVKQNVQMWRDYYLSQSIISSEIESVVINENDVKKYYNEKYKKEEYPEEVNIIEILVKDIETTQRVLNEIKLAKDFKELAKLYSQREWTKEKGGEYGFFPVTQFGKIGEAAAKMKIGEISKPIKVEEGYAIIKLIDKKKTRQEMPAKSYAEVKDRLKREIAYQIKYPDLLETTASLAEKFSISVNKDVLESLEITNLNSFAIRVMGFGGKITGVPIAKPFYEWVQKWSSKTKILP
ncbi:MAG: hypothetical protein A2068_09540 [Ignavibacteria bacterium GWB2_35_6b]|nr:MAG: hypothetical protein A2068_09540 [Ignavibacteria bacterium GWB2_35_6b]